MLEKLLTDIFSAYYDARRNKRNTANALLFEMNFESNLFELYEEIISGHYNICPSICFINFSPVQREIFAASFRDRVIHHLIYNYVYQIFDGTFINDSYSCRKGKGTHYGIKRIDHFIRSCSKNYKKDCYILKLDIRGYFMAKNRLLLFEKVKHVLASKVNKLEIDNVLLLSLIEKVIFNDPTKNCIIKGEKSDWHGLPKSKSLFYAQEFCGLPIGNLTSQLFGNVYMNEFDHFVKRNLGIKYYGRYVDDFILVHPDKEYLKWIITEIRKYLSEKLFLELHPNKIYLQHFSKGVSFLGTIYKTTSYLYSKTDKKQFLQFN
jgi:RNA-directed DNA polymerase